jgi:hypothetical protein
MQLALNYIGLGAGLFLSAVPLVFIRLLLRRQPSTGRYPGGVFNRNARRFEVGGRLPWNRNRRPRRRG